MTLAGRGSDEYAGAGARALGVVEDVTDFYKQIDLVVVPRGTQSTGISVKVIEAWEHGVEVIAPRNLLEAIGVAQLNARSDDAESIAEEIANFYQRTRTYSDRDLKPTGISVNAFWTGIQEQATTND